MAKAHLAVYEATDKLGTTRKWGQPSSNFNTVHRMYKTDWDSNMFQVYLYWTGASGTTLKSLRTKDYTVANVTLTLVFSHAKAHNFEIQVNIRSLPITKVRFLQRNKRSTRDEKKAQACEADDTNWQ
ncbi:hypothetical protein Bbelb_323760 [Branchiostoma belcheri]|nr:hypothetical protein Bbelb_323760 [Branchiostoma belcheri]